MKIEEKHNVIYSFSPGHSPVAEVTPGEVLVIETAHRFHGQIQDLEQRMKSTILSPATGPFYIVGAKPGDALEIEIIDIKTAEKGILAALPGCGVLGEKITEPMFNEVSLSTSTATLEGLSFPVQPALGIIGVAPEAGEVNCNISGAHGGNLCTKELSQGNKLLLPVFHPGALLALGSVQTLMGDGQVSGSGIETAAEVKIKVKVLAGLNIETPRIETKEGCLFLASAPTYAEAVKTAVQAAVKHIQRETGLSFVEAYMLSGACCQMGISRVAPVCTIKILVPNVTEMLHK